MFKRQTDDNCNFSCKLFPLLYLPLATMSTHLQVVQGPWLWDIANTASNSIILSLPEGCFFHLGSEQILKQLKTGLIKQKTSTMLCHDKNKQTKKRTTRTSDQKALLQYRILNPSYVSPPSYTISCILSLIMISHCVILKWLITSFIHSGHTSSSH